VCSMKNCTPTIEKTKNAAAVRESWSFIRHEIARNTQLRSSFADIRVTAWRTVSRFQSGWRRIGRGNVQKVPDDDRVVVRAADDLEVVKLQAEYAACVLLAYRMFTWGLAFKFLNRSHNTHTLQTRQSHKYLSRLWKSYGKKAHIGFSPRTNPS